MNSAQLSSTELSSKVLAILEPESRWSPGLLTDVIQYYVTIHTDTHTLNHTFAHHSLLVSLCLFHSSNGTVSREQENKPLLWQTSH